MAYNTRFCVEVELPVYTVFAQVDEEQQERDKRGNHSFLSEIMLGCVIMNGHLVSSVGWNLSLVKTSPFTNILCIRFDTFSVRFDSISVIRSKYNLFNQFIDVGASKYSE